MVEGWSDGGSSPDDKEQEQTWDAYLEKSAKEQAGMDRAFDEQIAAASQQAADTAEYQQREYAANQGLLGTATPSALSPEQYAKRLEQEDAQRICWEDRRLREQALKAALKTNNPSRDDLIQTAEALYAFLKGSQ